MPLGPGTRLGPYEIIAAIGAGGMGEVYRARDTKLNRDVALKILPAAFASDPDRLARFHREAQVLASLNHPHIGAIYGFEESEEVGAGFSRPVQALVLEFVDGPTLADRIAQGPIPPDEALPIALQIAEALEAAHEQGIIHRDLKPANIKLRPDGTVKVLDFGLAKLNDPHVPIGPSDPSALSMSPTITSPALMTGVGVLLGTAAYMAPEQARGRPVDKRADIWAFGCVLFEMMTGTRAFGGEETPDVIVALLSREPEWARLPANTSSVLRELLTRCLTKDPRQRLRDIGEARIQVRDAMERFSDASTATTPAPDRTRERLAWAVAALAVVIAIGASAILSVRRSAPETRTYRASILPPGGVNIPAIVVPSTRFALSPDGQRLAFVGAENPEATLGDILAGGATRLWVQSLDGSPPQALPGTDGALGPFWSPNGQQIGFRSNNKVKIITLAGGEPIALADTTGTHGGSWNREGVILFSSTGPGNPIHAVPATGGNPRSVTTLNQGNGEVQHWDPFFLPDGRHFLYLAIGTKSSPGTPNGIYAASLDSMEPKLLVPGGSNAMYAQGHLLYLRQQTLVAQPFDADQLMFTGDPVVIAQQVITGGGVGIRGAFTVSETGLLAYQMGAADVGGNSDPLSQLVWFDRSGKRIATVGEPARQQNPQLTSDEKHVAINVFDVARRTRDIWVVDAMRGLKTRLTFAAANEVGPVWAPDATRIAFSSDGQLHGKASSGAGMEETVVADNGGNAASDWSRDGRFILFSTSTALNGAAGVWVLPLFGDRKPFPFVDTSSNESLGLFSPDGRWVAYVSNESGRNEVYVGPFSGTPTASGISAPVGKWQVSTAGGNWHRWSKDGKEIFYLAPDNKLMVATVDGSGSAFDVGVVRPLFNMRPVTNQRFMYDVSADGGRFLVNAPVEEAPPTQPPITLVINWPGALPPK